ncbi:DMT family transporter [Gammaproteobacteria bacterium]|nr:DMT family transporter [Gammaproteobacteria bacterium]
MNIKKQTALSEKDKLYRAILWMCGTLISFATMAVAVRELTDTINSFEIVFLRTSVALSIILIIISIRGWKNISTKNLRLHIFRNTVHYIGNLTWIIGASLIPLAQVFALEFSIPIWVALFAVLFLKEKLTIGKVVAIGFGFMGVLVILRPGLMAIDQGSLAILCAALCFATANVITKSLSKTDNPLTILFLMFVMQLPISAIGAYFFWTVPVWEDWPWIFLVGIMSLTAHYCMTRAITLVDVTVIIPIDFMRMPIIAIIGFYLYNEPFSVWIFLGAALIFSGNYFNIYHERKKT